MDIADTGSAVTDDVKTINEEANGENGEEKEEEQANEEEGDCETELKRVQVCNIPIFLGHKAFRKLLDKSLGSLAVKKIRLMRDTAYVSFSSAEDATAAVPLIDGLVVKKATLSAKIAPPEPRKGANLPRPEEARVKTARESVTPLADVFYEEQLNSKTKECHRIAKNLLTQMWKAFVPGMKGVNSHQILNKIRPSPVTSGYRNKCEFTVGKDLDGKIRVGFVGGRFSKNEHYVLPVDDCDNMSNHMKRIVREFATFVEESGMEPFDEFARKGTWKMLTLRELSGDVMLIVTVFPFEDKEKEKEEKTRVIERFCTGNTFERGFRVTSLYWQVQEHASDSAIYEHVYGAPYIYETLLGVRFRVSPDAFFQTNSAAAAVLYKTIGEACSLRRCSEEVKNVEVKGEDEQMNGEEKKESEVRGDETNGEAKKEDEVKREETDGKEEKKADDGEEGPQAKKAKLEEAEDVKVEGETTIEKEDAKEKVAPEECTVLLDICCGTGTIGQCIMKNLSEDVDKTFCIGLELVESAVRDARINATDNGIPERRCCYVAGKAEDSFRGLRHLVPAGFSLEKSRVVGIIDPPRRGIHERVVVGCRQLSSMRRLIFVSCDPSAATKNIVDLCRPRSRKFEGEPFRLEKITPVDMFPQTAHVEWVLTLVR